MKIATERVWLTEDGRLVSEGDKDAATLFAIPGTRFPEGQLKDLKGTSGFFKDENLQEPTEHVPVPRVTSFKAGETNVGKKMEAAKTTVTAKPAVTPSKVEKVEKKTAKGR